MTSIVLKKDVTMLDIQSTRMLGQVGFLAKVGLLQSTPQNHWSLRFEVSQACLTFY